MAGRNQFLPFAIGGGANVQSQSTYAANPLLGTGNEPGVAVSAFVNKSLRQANMVVSQLAQLIQDNFGVNVDDSGVTAQVKAQLAALTAFIAPGVTSFSSGSSTFYLTYAVFCASCNATNGATYSDGTNTFTVAGTVSSSIILYLTGVAAAPSNPGSAGTLTKMSGSGDATITYYAVRAPLYLRGLVVGAGGGGSGSGTASIGTGGTGGTSSFGGSAVSCPGGTGGSGSSPGTGGTPSTSGVGILRSIIGTPGLLPADGLSKYALSGPGGQSPLSGQGPGVSYGGAVEAGLPAESNTGSGGGGASGNGPGNTILSGTGGAAGAYVEFIIDNPAASYATVVGAAGAAGTAGTGGQAGGPGGSGLIVIESHYQ